MSQSQFSLVTYNIHKGFGVGRIRFLLPQMRTALSGLSPDFMFLQEVQGEHTRREKRIRAWPSMSQVEYMAEEAWPYYLYSKNAVYQAGHHGNAILSKYKFDSFESMNLSHINRASRGFLYAQIKVSDMPLQVIHLLCVHLGLFKNERLSQCRKLMTNIIQKIPNNDPLIMAGDFNDWRHQLSRPLKEELGIQEAFYSLKGQHAKSFPALKPTLCMDRIYFRALNILDVKSLQGKPWRLLSDHVPLYAQFTFL